MRNSTVSLLFTVLSQLRTFGLRALALVTVVVVSLALPAAAQSIRTQNDVYTANAPIVVQYAGLPGNKQDWITIVGAGSSDSSYGQYFYTNGSTSGQMSFNGLSAGRYEVRLYLDWPAGGYTVWARYPFTVGAVTQQPLPTTINLTGYWEDDYGGSYALRQVGNQLWWLDDGRPDHFNVFGGTIDWNAHSVSGGWVDLPGGDTQSSGSLSLRIESNDRLSILAQTGGYAGSVLRRQGEGVNDYPPSGSDVGAQGFSGFWGDNVGGKYALRQVGNTLCWMDDGRPYYLNVFCGTVDGNTNTASGVWMDLPGGGTQSYGSITLRLEPYSRLIKTAETGGYSGSVLSRRSGGTTTSTNPPPVVVGAVAARGWNIMSNSLGSRVGQQFVVECEAGGYNTRLWGTDVYTDDSSVCMAGVHAGAISREQGGQVLIEIRSGQASYVGSTRNGVTSTAYGSWGGSFVVLRCCKG